MAPASSPTQELQPEVDLGPTLHEWPRLLRKLKRLAFKRRLWAHLGQLLHAIKAQGRGQDHHLLHHLRSTGSGGDRWNRRRR